MNLEIAGMAFAATDTGQHGITWSVYDLECETRVGLSKADIERNPNNITVIDPFDPRIRGRMLETVNGDGLITVEWITEEEPELVNPADILKLRPGGYLGTHALKNGDSLEIYDRTNPDELIWSGVIDLRPRRVRSNVAINDAQVHVDSNEWYSYFAPESPAILRRQ